MTNEQINEAMAVILELEPKWIGIYDTEPSDSDSYDGMWRWSEYADEPHWHPKYDFTADLNAVALVVEKLTESQKASYHFGLRGMMKGAPRKAIDAGPLQRCKAILRARGEWVE